MNTGMITDAAGPQKGPVFNRRVEQEYRDILVESILYALHSKPSVFLLDDDQGCRIGIDIALIGNKVFPPLFAMQVIPPIRAVPFLLSHHAVSLSGECVSGALRYRERQ